MALHGTRPRARMTTRLFVARAHTINMREITWCVTGQGRCVVKGRVLKCVGVRGGFGPCGYRFLCIFLGRVELFMATMATMTALLGT